MSDSISIRFPCMSVSFPITIHTTSTLTNYRLDYVGQCLNFPVIPDKHVELSSVCVSPPGATSSRLDGPSEKVQVRLYPVDVSKRNQGGLCAMD